MDLVKEREMCVYHLTDQVGVDQSTVSKHLAILKEVGLVGVRMQGTLSYYRITCGCLDDFFACIETVLFSDIKSRQTTETTLS